MLVNEIFYSLQGEGLNMGRASIFIRLSKCNLSCSFCDTEFESGVEMTLEEVRDRIAQWPGKRRAHPAADGGDCGLLQGSWLPSVH